MADTVGGHSGDLESFQAREDVVLVTMCWRRDDPGEAPLARVFHVVRVASGQIARISVFLDEAAARAAAGMER